MDDSTIHRRPFNGAVGTGVLHRMWPSPGHQEMVRQELDGVDWEWQVGRRSHGQGIVLGGP